MRRRIQSRKVCPQVTLLFELLEVRDLLDADALSGGGPELDTGLPPFPYDEVDRQVMYDDLRNIEDPIGDDRAPSFFLSDVDLKDETEAPSGPAFPAEVVGHASDAFPVDLFDRDFMVFDDIALPGEPNLVEDYGLQPLTRFTQWYVWDPSSSDHSMLTDNDLAWLRKSARNLDPRWLFIVNIENWPTYGDEAVVAESIRKLALVVDTIKEVNPHVVTGIYGVMPVRDYFTPVSSGYDSPQFAAWAASNARLQELANHVDVIVPSVYTFYPDYEADGTPRLYERDRWVQYATANLLQARQYGKPVVSYVWPLYHGGGGSTDPASPDYRYWKLKPIGADFWKLILDTVHQYSDSTAIYESMATSWDDNAPWWLATQDFLSEVLPARAHGEETISGDRTAGDWRDTRTNDNATVTITVNSVNDPLVARNDRMTIAALSPVTVDVLADNGSGADRFQDEVLGDDQTLNNAPTDPIVVNTPPVAYDDLVNTIEDLPIRIDLLADNGQGQDLDVDGTLDANSVVLTTEPSHGALLQQGHGVFLYTPHLHFTGIDSFTYTVADDAEETSNAATVTVHVAAGNLPPLGRDDAIETNEGTPITFNVLGDHLFGVDRDLDGSLLPTSVVNLNWPLVGSLTNYADGRFRYAPPANFSGKVQFHYLVQDNEGASTKVYEAITEELYDDNERSRLEHVWFFDVIAGDAQAVVVSGFHDSETEDFGFDYSTDGVNWNPMTARLTNAGQLLEMVLPPGIQGALQVRVTDSNRSLGDNVADSVYVEYMYVRSARTAHPELPQLSISDAIVAETPGGTAVAQFLVTRSGDTLESVTFAYETVDGSAVATADYAPIRLRTALLGRGVTERVISVPILDDTLAETAETFFVRLSLAVGANISDAQGEATIGASDNPPIAVAAADGSYGIDVGQQLVLSGTGSYDPDEASGDAIVSYEWDLGADGSYEYTGKTVTVPWTDLQNLPQPGVAIPLRLRVKDISGAMDTNDTQLRIFDITPTVNVSAVTPDLRTTFVSSLQIFFSEPVLHFDLGDITLSRNADPVALTGASLTTADRGMTWTLADLSGLTNLAGDYELTVDPSDITDQSANSLVDGGFTSWRRQSFVPAMGRQIFYNASAWDGNDRAANASDDAAIATDKQALLPAQTASFANYTSYSLGINGIMIDIDGLPGPLSADDFSFRIGNDDHPESWLTGPTPTSLTVRPGAGVGGADRVTVIWPDRDIEGQWLQVTVLANPNTGLPLPDVHYWGNYVGETGDSATDAVVDLEDRNRIRDKQNNFLTLAEITNPYDLNRDRWVDLVDRNLVRDNQSNFLSQLLLMTAPAAGSIGGSQVEVLRSSVALNSVRADSWAAVGQPESISSSPIEEAPTGDASQAPSRWDSVYHDIPIDRLNSTRGKRTFRVMHQGQTRQDPGCERAVDCLFGDLKLQESCYTQWIFRWI